METFRQYLADHVANYVQLGRSGPEACQGRILHVGRDYMTLACFDQTRLHLPLHHLRSVTPFPYPPPDDPLPLAPGETWPDSFDELLASYIGQTVRLNYASPEFCIGTLLAATDQYLLLEVGPGDRICHARFHLRSLSLYKACEPESEGDGKGS